MRLVSAAPCSLLFALALFAQNDRGTLTGTVQDPANAMVPNAPVIAINTATGAESRTVTTATGNYTIPSLPAGAYKLTVKFTPADDETCKPQKKLSASEDVTGSVTLSLRIGLCAPKLGESEVTRPVPLDSGKCYAGAMESTS